MFTVFGELFLVFECAILSVWMCFLPLYSVLCSSNKGYKLPMTKKCTPTQTFSVQSIEFSDYGNPLTLWTHWWRICVCLGYLQVCVHKATHYAAKNYVSKQRETDRVECSYIRVYICVFVPKSLNLSDIEHLINLVLWCHDRSDFPLPTHSFDTFDRNEHSKKKDPAQPKWTSQQTTTTIFQRLYTADDDEPIYHYYCSKAAPAVYSCI